MLSCVLNPSQPRVTSNYKYVSKTWKNYVLYPGNSFERRVHSIKKIGLNTSHKRGPCSHSIYLKLSTHNTKLQEF
jgi:hypothetical protein